MALERLGDAPGVGEVWVLLPLVDIRTPHQLFERQVSGQVSSGRGLKNAVQVHIVCEETHGLNAALDSHTVNLAHLGRGLGTCWLSLGGNISDKLCWGIVVHASNVYRDVST